MVSVKTIGSLIDFVGNYRGIDCFFFFPFILNFVLRPFIDIDGYSKILNLEMIMVLKISLYLKKGFQDILRS